MIIFGALFARHLGQLDAAAVWACFVEVKLWQWAAALIFTALSFRAVGTYDVIIHRALNTGQNPQTARRAGIKAIALSQTLGFGTATSALVRWRCLPAMSVGAVLRLSAAVSLSFIAGLAIVAAIVIPFSGLMLQSGFLLVLGAFLAVFILILIAKQAERQGWIRGQLDWRTLFGIVMATAADTALAAAALWVLWAEPISFQLIFAAYLIALGAGLLSNAPGGVGAFDLTLLALLPVSDEAAVMASVLAFRVIYYAVPAGITLLSLIKPANAQSAGPVHHPEAALLMQSANRFDIKGQSLLTLPSFGAGTVLGDLPDHIDPTAIAKGGLKSIYKCSAASALAARSVGWSVLRCAEDAVLDPQSWSTQGPARRQLRRSLRIFEKSGVSISQITNPETLAGVAAEWAQHHGGERGLSMGRYCPNYLHQQKVFAAFDGTEPIAFISFHSGATWTLDLMRHRNEIPKGTMQALVVAAIEAARRDGAPHLSLAAVPAPDPKLPFAQRGRDAAAGLRRFKSSFGPEWQPRYICAANPALLALTMATLAIGIHFPPKSAPYRIIHPDHEDFSFAPAILPMRREHEPVRSTIP